MSKVKKNPSSEVTDFLNENLKLVFQELSEDAIPDEIGDLLRFLKAQDETLEAKK